MKNILYLTFYFEPDLCAGSFRNTPLAKELAKQAVDIANIEVITTLPNRYNSFAVEAPEFEEKENLRIHRIKIPSHQSGMKDQILSFKTYFQEVKKITKNKKYDLVFASSSRLFTGYLGYSVAKSLKAPLYLDIRDIFYDTIEDVLDSKLLKFFSLPVIKSIEKRTFDYASHINLISGGFKAYFDEYGKKHFSFFPNGIDDIFIEANAEEIVKDPLKNEVTIVYAGNLGEGQGLDKIIPEAAAQLGSKYKFIIIGDGGAKIKLQDQVKKLELNNVEFRQPIKRDELLKVYQDADYLFVHLNNFKAFEKVLPSKLFELATFPQPLIAGVGGFAAKFVKDNIDNSILFQPCNVEEFVSKMKNFEYKLEKRTSFIERFKRDSVNQEMAKTILDLVK